jgi:hypothetical protein
VVGVAENELMVAAGVAGVTVTSIELGELIPPGPVQSNEYTKVPAAL